MCSSDLDGMIVIPRDRDILDDHRLVKLINGVGRIPDERTGEKDKKRHGDSAIASALAVAASRTEPEIYGYEGAGTASAKPGAANGWRDRADEEEDEPLRNGDGIFPNMTRRVYG